MAYRPLFDSPRVEATARRRGLLDGGESLRGGMHRVGRELGRLDRELGGPDDDLEDRVDAALACGAIAVSSQLFAAAGRSADVAACTVLPVAGATDETRVTRAVAEATAASEAGMGCGLDLSDFDDPARAAVEINAAMRQVHDSLTARDRRPPALMLSCDGGHPRVEIFARVKNVVDFTAWVANISVKVSGDDDEWERLRPLLAVGAHANGEPGVLFQGAADADNPTPDVTLTSTAPCAEVFLSPGERCVFLSVNLAAHVREGAFDWPGFVASVGLAVRAGDAAVELACGSAPPVVAARRRLGVGVCGYHTALIMMGLPYARSVGFARRLAEVLTHAAHRASAALAATRGPFPLFPESRWRDQAWLRRKAHRRVGAVSAEEWSQLESAIGRHGVRHCAVVAYPPTGVVAELLGVSRSYEPHYTLVGRTGVAATNDVELVPEVARAVDEHPGSSTVRAAILDPASGHQVPGAEVDDVLACARQLPADVHLAVHTAFSALADEAGSKTVNLPAHATIDDVAVLLDEARGAGLKGLTVFRDGCLDRREDTA